MTDEINTTESNSRHIEIVSDEMAEILRRKTPTERLAMAHGMWRAASRRIYHSIRGEHPEWNDLQIMDETNRRFLTMERPE